MATRELSLFADLDQGRLVQSFLSTLQATLPRFVFGDSIPVSFRPLKSNGNNSVNPWSEVDLTGKTVRIAIGNPAGAASSGTFTLSYGGDTTAAIAYNADGAAIQTALNALASITAAGGVVVTRAATGAFRIVFNAAGARTAITADAAAIYPSAGVEIHVSVEGDGSTREIVVARLEVLPAAYAELSDDLPDAAADIVEVRAGSVSVGAILSFGFSVLPYSGFYTLEIGGEQTLGIPWDADASTLQAALELLSTVGAGKVIVSGDWPSFTLNFDVSLGDIGAMTIDMTGLVVPKGRAGILNTNTAAMIELLNGASQATAKLEVELYDIADDTTWTVLQTDCTVIDDVIGNDPATVPPFPSVINLITPGNSAPVNEVIGVNQVETTSVVTYADPLTCSGNLNVVIMSALVAGSPLTVPVNVTGLTTGVSVAAAIRATLSATSAISSHFSIGGSGAYVVLTANVAAENDATLNIAWVAGAGVPAPLPGPSSTNTTSGVAPVAATESPPFIRVSGGYLYIQDSATWKRVALSTF